MGVALGSQTYLQDLLQSLGYVCWVVVCSLGLFDAEGWGFFDRYQP